MPRRGSWVSIAVGCEAMVGAIVGFRIRVKRLDAKLKLSQNRSPDDQRTRRGRSRKRRLRGGHGHRGLDAGGHEELIRRQPASIVTGGV